MEILKVLIEFVVTFIIIYLIYYLMIIRKCKKDNKLVPAEVNVILILHKINPENIDIYKMVKVVSVVTTMILSLIITIIGTFFKSRWILLVFGTLLSLIVAIICYRKIGKHYKNISDSKEELKEKPSVKKKNKK